MYRERDRYSKKLENARKKKKRIRLEADAPEYPIDLPDLRRSIIIIDHDFGTVVHRIDLYKTDRVDCYRAVADGKPWKDRIGWSNILAGIRKSFIRVGATA